jgi:glucoamylase
MARIRGENFAYGWPGIPPRWTAGSKDGVGTAYADASKVWFTLWKGILTEVYWPRIDSPQTRDLQFLITDGSSFFHEEKRDLTSTMERMSLHSLGYSAVNREPEGRYTITKNIIADPMLPCVLQRTKIDCKKSLRERMRLFVLFSPHMDRGGADNEAYVMEQSGREFLVAHKGDSWCALGATVPFKKLSAGFVGASDGWKDISEHFEMTWEFDQALNGNVALTGELDLTVGLEFTIGLAFGDTLQSAIATLFQALGFRFEERKHLFEEEWESTSKIFLPLGKDASDGGKLYASSTSLLLAHEDKTYPGAFAASLSIPWGEAKGDEDLGGYHLVWTRDLVNTAMGLLAAGDTMTPLRVLIYLAATQHHDGGFSQNFWVDGEPYWRGMQLDEVAMPILLARRLADESGLQEFDPYNMVLRGASYLITNGPATEQERWEESSGYSPSTLAAVIAALIAAACFAEEHDDEESAEYLRDYADFLECHLEGWTVTNAGTLVPGIPKHFIRILPIDVSNPIATEDPDQAMISLKNQPPNEQTDYPAKEIVDAGFLELVRYGIRSADDPIIVDSVKVVDAVLGRETPLGASFHRYNHDGYGQRDDGSSFVGWGRGRLWPLLTGERGHYELAAGRDAGEYLKAIEHFATVTGLLTEQVWDSEESPEDWLKLGLPTGAAMPLMWAHAEYIRLLRSIRDGKVFDLVPEVAERYLGKRKDCKKLEIWKPNRQPASIHCGSTLRIQAPEPFTLHWSLDEWATQQESQPIATKLGVYYFDVNIGEDQQGTIGFTFLWTARDEWETVNYEIAIVASAG